jgi:hypothetical protein
MDGGVRAVARFERFVGVSNPNETMFSDLHPSSHLKIIAFLI